MYFRTQSLHLGNFHSNQFPAISPLIFQGNIEGPSGPNYPTLGQDVSQDNSDKATTTTTTIQLTTTRKRTMKNTTRMANTTTITTTTTNYKTIIFTDSVFALHHRLRQIRPTSVSIPQNKNCVRIQLTKLCSTTQETMSYFHQIVFIVAIFQSK